MCGPIIENEHLWVCTKFMCLHEWTAKSMCHDLSTLHCVCHGLICFCCCWTIIQILQGFATCTISYGSLQLPVIKYLKPPLSQNPLKIWIRDLCFIYDVVDWWMPTTLCGPLALCTASLWYTQCYYSYFGVLYSFDETSTLRCTIGGDLIWKNIHILFLFFKWRLLVTQRVLGV